MLHNKNDPTIWLRAFIVGWVETLLKNDNIMRNKGEKKVKALYPSNTYE